MNKLLGDELNLFHEENKEKLKIYEQDLKEVLEGFTEEVIIQEPDWFKECRIRYLAEKLIKLQAEIDWWEMIAKMYPGWLEDTIIEANVLPDKKEQKRIGDEIYAYEKPQQINYDKLITENDIEKANAVDCSTLLETKRIGKRNWALCPFHHDRNPSLLCYSEQGNGRHRGDGYYCFSCGAHGNTIDLVRHLYHYNFIEAVRYLLRK